MAWTETTRAEYRRDGLRYASDMTDAEWAVIAPLLPGPSPLGRARTANLREVVNAIVYLATGGGQWRALPREFPPRSTVQGYFYRWRDDGTWADLMAGLVVGAPMALGRQPRPSAAVIDSSSVATTRSGGPRGVDAGKRVKGRKRHIVTDGLLLAVQVHPADIQDCHGAVPLLKSLRRQFPKLSHVFADRGYRGQQLLDARADTGKWTIQVIKRPDGVKGFQLLPRRWVVERTFAWLGRCRCLSKDFEAIIASAVAWI